MKSPSLPLVVCALLAVTAAALGDVEITIENGAKIQGSITDPGTEDTYELWCPAGATLQVKAKGKKGLSLDTDVALPSVVTKAPALGGEVPASGIAAVTVRGAGGDTGDYAVSVSYRLPKKTKYQATLGAGSTMIRFSAVAGTVMKAKAKARKGSAAMPVIDVLQGPGIVVDQTGADSPSFSATGLGTDGDYQLLIADAGGAGGEIEVTVQLKQPKAVKRRLDLRAKALANAAGERLAVSAIVDAVGGVVGVPLPAEGGPDSLISGSSVSVPVGALTQPTPIIVGTSSDVKPLGADGGAGPSVFFGPEGLSFSEDVTVTIPFDVAQFAGDFSSLRIYTRDAQGKVTLVDGIPEVDLDAGTCTFQVSHFSSFRAARADALAALLNVVGAWRLVPQAPGDPDAFLIINADGTVETIVDLPEINTCYRYVILRPGDYQVPLEDVFQVVDGKLRLDDGQDVQEYEPAKKSDVPKNCSELPL